MAQIIELLNTGSGMQMSGVYIHQDEHPQKVFERAMAEYIGFGAAMLCQSGYTANVGLMEFLNNDYMEQKPIFYFDMFAHMSFLKGVNSAQGKVMFFRHNNPNSLEKTIRKNAGRPGIIVVDSIYSIQGTIAPLDDIEKIAREYGCILVVDESHSLGVFGSDGSGLCQKFQIQPDFITASLAKTFAFQGGIVFAKNNQIGDAFRFISNPAIFSSIPAPYVSSRGLETLKIVREESVRREKLYYNSEYLRSNFRLLGYDIGATQSQIISMVIGSEELTVYVRDLLEKNKIFTSLFTTPATPKNKALIRMSVNSGLAQEDLDYILKIFDMNRINFKPRDWPEPKKKLGVLA